jgi:hypothetical protein
LKVSIPGKDNDLFLRGRKRAALGKFHNSESQKVIAILILIIYQLSGCSIARDRFKTFDEKELLCHFLT